MSAAAVKSDVGNARWIQLVLGVVAMMAISSPQYVWTLFVKSFEATTGATLPAIQITFSLLIVLQTFFSPLQGWLIDKVRGVLDTLPADQRGPLELAYFQGLSHTEIAARTGSPLGTVKTRIRAGLMTIRKAMNA